MKHKPKKTEVVTETVLEPIQSSIGHTPRSYIGKVLVPVDFSDDSRKAIQYATAIARQFGAVIVLMHVVEPPIYGADFGYVPAAVQLSSEENLEKAKRRLNALAKKEIKKGLSAETVAMSGEPYDEITRAAEALKIDLIVIAAHGQTRFEHAMLGSTTERVVRYAPCPVFIVRKREHELVGRQVASRHAQN